MHKKSWKRVMASLFAGALVLSLALTATPVDAKKKKKDKAPEFDPSGTYHAALGVQTATNLWIMRFAYFDKDQNEHYGTDLQDSLVYDSKENPGEIATATGTFTDAEIAGNGTYTVSLSGADFLGETCLSQLHIATDIPTSADVTFSDVVFKLNNRTIAEFDEAVMEDEAPYIVGGMDILVINHWREALRGILADQGVSEDAESGYNLLAGAGDDNLSVTFTVSGFDYDNTSTTDDGSATDDTSADSASTDSAADDSTDTAGDAASATTDQNSTSANDSSESSSPTAAIAIVIVVILVIGIVVVVIRKKGQR